MEKTAKFGPSPTVFCSGQFQVWPGMFKIILAAVVSATFLLAVDSVPNLNTIDLPSEGYIKDADIQLGVIDLVYSIVLVGRYVLCVYACACVCMRVCVCSVCVYASVCVCSVCVYAWVVFVCMRV